MRSPQERRRYAKLLAAVRKGGDKERETPRRGEADCTRDERVRHSERRLDVVGVSAAPVGTILSPDLAYSLP
jgi:hypothetical protein